MRAEYKRRWDDEILALGADIRTPQDLVARPVSPDDYADSAVIGGIGVADIIAGKISESQIPPDVIEAFHLQYPRDGSFVDAVRAHAGDPSALRGLIDGVKGKLFEVDYVEWLNGGHLPDGWTAGLAEKANQPAWDIVIRDSHGNVDELLQLKATASVSYVHEALLRYPDIPIAVPHELYDRLADDPNMAGMLVDGHQSLSDLNVAAEGAADHAVVHVDYFHIPEIAIAFAAIQNFSRYRGGRISLGEAFKNTGSRSALAVIASAAGWGAGAAANSTVVGIPVAIGTRLLCSQALHNFRRRKELQTYFARVASSTTVLQAQLERPVLGPG